MKTQWLDPTKISDEAREVLESIGIRPHRIQKINMNTDSIYVNCSGYTDGEYLIFFEEHRGGNHRNQTKYIYNMGGENEAGVVAKFNGVTVWDGMESRVVRYFDEELEDPPDDPADDLDDDIDDMIDDDGPSTEHTAGSWPGKRES